MKKEFEENSKKVDTQMLKQIIKDIGRMETGIVKSFKKKVAKVESLGIAIPTDLKEALAELEGIIAKVKALTSMEELADSGLDQMGALMPDLQQGFQRLSQLEFMPKAIKGIEKQLNSYEKKYTKLEKAAVKVDLTDQLKELRVLLDEKKSDIAKLKELMKSESTVEDVFDEMESFGPDAFDDINEKMFSISSVLDVVKNFSKFKKGMQTDLKQKARLVKKFAKHEKGGELGDSYKKLEQLLKKIEDTFKAKPLNIDNLEEAFENYEDERNAFQDLLEEITGVEVQGYFEAPQQKEKSPSFDIPSSVGGLLPVAPPQQEAPVSPIFEQDIQGGGPEQRPSIIPTQGIPQIF